MDKTLDLDELERVAREAASAAETEGRWVVLEDDGDVGVVRAASDDVWIARTGAAGYPAPTARAAHIATFDPPTILTLIAAARPAETRDWSEFEDEIADAISDSIDMDWQSRDGARAVVALLNKDAPRTKPTETAWLIEWPATRQDVVRYWHPTEGHVIDPNHAVRFCRREDAEAMCKRDHLGAGARPVEHMWVSK